MARGRSVVHFDESVTKAELDALDELGANGAWTVDGRAVHVTNLDKVLFDGRDGEPPITKRELIAYFARIANVMLPYLEQRPVNSHRYPDGRRTKGIWQKAVPDHAPSWITRWHNDEADEGVTEWYAVVDSIATLVWTANFAAIELHPWTSRAYRTFTSRRGRSSASIRVHIRRGKRFKLQLMTKTPAPELTTMIAQLEGVVAVQGGNRDLVE